MDMDIVGEVREWTLCGSQSSREFKRRETSKLRIKWWSEEYQREDWTLSINFEHQRGGWMMVSVIPSSLTSSPSPSAFDCGRGREGRGRGWRERQKRRKEATWTVHQDFNGGCNWRRSLHLYPLSLSSSLLNSSPQTSSTLIPLQIDSEVEMRAEIVMEIVRDARCVCPIEQIEIKRMLIIFPSVSIRGVSPYHYAHLFLPLSMEQ